jgi:hypothetical protein
MAFGITTALSNRFVTRSLTAADTLFTVHFQT